MYDNLKNTISNSSQTLRKKRRSFGVSRKQKQRQKQLGFETLEDRRVMSAQSPLESPLPLSQALSQANVQSYSSATPEGQAAILQDELNWYLLSSSNASTAPSSVAPYSIPTDPLLGKQWHLINSGQQVGNPDYQAIYGVPGEDINVAPAWNDGDFGQGVLVAVIDSGVQTNHPDLAANIDPNLQYDALDLDGNANPRPVPPLPGQDYPDPSNAHGTAVAGIIGAVANNGIGGTGIAPNAQIVPIRLIDPDVIANSNPTAFADAFRYVTANNIDITNNSWGPSIPGGRGVLGPTPDELLALRDSIIFGRDGKGIIHVFAAGNNGGPQFNDGFQSIGGYDTTAYNGWASSRYTIAVTGVDHDGFYNNVDGTFTAYPATGPGVLVAAPTGSNAALNIINDTGLGSGIVTTDETGDPDNGLGGFNIPPDPVTGQEFDRDFLADDDYTSRFNGTSASAPMVSGVIALMLEANPDLSWRDVQEILVRSARQNAQFGIPQNGLQQGTGAITQNTWIINQIPLFQSPDPYNPAIPASIQTLTPTADPNILSPIAGDFDHLAPTAQLGAVGGGSGLVNGAGYTISQGVGPEGEQVGYAHGVVDAGLAVQLARQWTSKDQTLPDELTFSTFVNPVGLGSLSLPAVEKGNQASGFQLVPGKLGGNAGFIAYWNEYFADAPDFSKNFPDQGTSLKLAVPDNNTMSIESVEVKVSISGGAAAALDNLRIALVSPDGVHSELNHNWVDTLGVPYSQQNDGPGIQRGAASPGSVDTQGGNLIWTFETNRNWGERSDNDLVFDATTGEPVIDTSGASSLYGAGIGDDPFLPGGAMQQGWNLVFENWGSTALSLDDVEVAWHGSPIGANTQRIQGFVGVDDNLDDQFNFTRMGQQTEVDLDGDPTTQRYGELLNTIDQTQESFASNVTVVARRASDNVKVAEFVTGADGNYYFDLVPDDYIISVEDPLGRDAVDDSITPAGLLQHYKAQWDVSKDYFKVWDRDTNLEVPIDPTTNAPFAWLDGNGAETEYGVKNINFLLDPGAPPAPEVIFAGNTFVDYDGNGVFDGKDVSLPNVSVYGDVNRNGAFDAGEPIVKTDASGNYSLTVDSSITSVINVGVVAPFSWTVSSPENGIQTRFSHPGDSFSDVDFALKPPVGNVSLGNAQPGIVLGSVFEDVNGNGNQDVNEHGISGMRVYVDINNSGVFDAGDIETTTNLSGSYAITDLDPGTYQIRTDVYGSFVQVSPAPGFPFTVTLGGSATIQGLDFAIRNTAVLDYGDLPAYYGITTNAEDGARHRKGNVYLGTRIDAELDGQPSPNADGDDAVGNDEDGIVFPTLTPGSTVTFTATASAYGGFLKGWIDWNDDGVMDPVAERVEFSDPSKPGVPASNNWLLNIGVNTLQINVPAGVTAPGVYARFRLAESEVNTLTGPALIGEVEDYFLPVTGPTPVVQSGEPGDFDGNGSVDGSDFLSWQLGFGAATGASHEQGDSNLDGDVDQNDLVAWQAGYSQNTSPASFAQPASGDFNLDGQVDGGDFLSWQTGFGLPASLASGNGNDLNGWQQSYGDGSLSSGDSLAAATTNSLLAGAQQPLPTASVSTATAPNDLVSLAAAQSLQSRDQFFSRADETLDDVREPFGELAANLLGRRDLAFEGVAHKLRDQLADRIQSKRSSDDASDAESHTKRRDRFFANLEDAFLRRRSS